MYVCVYMYVFLGGAFHHIFEQEPLRAAASKTEDAGNGARVQV